MGTTEQSGATAGSISRLKLVHKWKVLAVVVFVALTALILPFFYEPFRIPDYLDNVLFQSSNSETVEQTIELLNENSVYHFNPSDLTSREIVTGLRFSRSGDALVIEHPRLSGSAVSKIRKRIENDEEFLWWKLSPETLKQREKDKGGDTPSWQDAGTRLFRVGFTVMRFTNGHESWDLPLRSVAGPPKK